MSPRVRRQLSRGLSRRPRGLAAVRGTRPGPQDPRADPAWYHWGEETPGAPLLALCFR